MFSFADFSVTTLFNFTMLTIAFYYIISIVWVLIEKSRDKYNPNKRDTIIAVISSVLLAFIVHVASGYISLIYVLGNLLIVIMAILACLNIAYDLIFGSKVKQENKELKESNDILNKRLSEASIEKDQWKHYADLLDNKVAKQENDIQKLKEDKDILETAIGYYTKKYKETEEQLEECEGENCEE